jgi:hypothetical protein
MLAVLAALAPCLSLCLAGCAWDTGDEAVYYEHAPKHELDDNGSTIDDPSGLGATPNKDVASPDPTSDTPVQSGQTPRLVPVVPEPEPQPWIIFPTNKYQQQAPVGSGTVIDK